METVCFALSFLTHCSLSAFASRAFTHTCRIHAWSSVVNWKPVERDQDRGYRPKFSYETTTWSHEMVKTRTRSVTVVKNMNCCFKRNLTWQPQQEKAELHNWMYLFVKFKFTINLDYTKLTKISLRWGVRGLIISSYRCWVTKGTQKIKASRTKAAVTRLSVLPVEKRWISSVKSTKETTPAFSKYLTHKHPQTVW